MQCEICDQEIEGLKTCDHPKNAYCALFAKKAEKDIKQFGPKHYKTLADLEVGETFRYKGSADDDWHTVSAIDNEKIYYPGYLSDRPNSNYRVDNVEVIIR